jgi:hypothetical protein
MAGSFILPTLGTVTIDNEAEVVSILDGRVLESSDSRREYEHQADSNLQFYAGIQWSSDTPENTVRVTVNRILNAIIAQAAVQTEETPKIKFTPRESLEPPRYYLNTNLDAPPMPELTMLMDSLPAETRLPWLDEATGEMQLPRALTNQEVQIIEQAITLSAQAAMQLGREPTIPADVLVGINDRIAAESLQTIVDAKWDECDGDFKIGENLLYSGIVGWQWLLFEWDDDNHTPILKNVPFLQVHIDPLATDVRDAQYVIYDQVISADEASALYPDLESEIRAAAAPGQVQPAGSDYRQAAIYGAVNFRRDMLTLRTAWLRNQPKPLTVQEALERQLVTTETLTEEKPTICTCGSGLGVPMSQHAEGCECREGYTASPMDGLVAEAPEMITDEEAMNPEVVPVEGAPAEEVTPPEEQLPPATKTTEKVVYKLVKTGAEVEEGKEGWPTRPILRQIRTIVSHVVDDRECEFVDVPICLNINIPIPFSPYGQGEPERLKGLQVAINSILSDMIAHWDFHGRPAEVVPQSVNDMLPEYAREAYTHMPGTKFVVPDDLLVRLGGKLGITIDPPQLPPDGWRLLELLIKLFDDASDESEVLQGRAAPGWSGEAIASLQSAAKGAIGWKSRRTERLIKYLAKLISGAIVNRMPTEAKAVFMSKYPPQVWNALDTKIRNLEADVSISIASGSGAKRQAEQASDLSLYDRKVLSKTSLLESVGKDPAIERLNLLKEAREDASAMAQTPPGTQPVPAGQQQPQQQQQPTAPAASPQ